MSQSVIIRKPAGAMERTFSPKGQNIFALEFSSSGVRLSRNGDNLVFAFNDESRIVFKDFYINYMEENLPQFGIDGAVMDSKAFFAVFNAMDIIPVAVTNGLSEIDETSAMGEISEVVNVAESVGVVENIDTYLGENSDDIPIVMSDTELEAVVEEMQEAVEKAVAERAEKTDRDELVADSCPTETTSTETAFITVKDAIALGDSEYKLEYGIVQIGMDGSYTFTAHADAPADANQAITFVITDDNGESIEQTIEIDIAQAEIIDDVAHEESISTIDPSFESVLKESIIEESILEENMLEENILDESVISESSVFDSSFLDENLDKNIMDKDVFAESIAPENNLVESNLLENSIGENNFGIDVPFAHVEDVSVSEALHIAPTPETASAPEIQEAPEIPFVSDAQDATSVQFIPETPYSQDNVESLSTSSEDSDSVTHAKSNVFSQAQCDGWRKQGDGDVFDYWGDDLGEALNDDFDDLVECASSESSEGDENFVAEEMCIGKNIIAYNPSEGYFR